MKAINQNTQKRELLFFYQRQQWDSLGEGTFDGRLFAQRLQLPLTADLLDQYCAPYVWGYGAKARPVPSLGSLLHTGMKTLGMGMHPENSQVQRQLIHQISILNFCMDEQGTVLPCTIDACFEAGWWCASFSIGALVPQSNDNPLEHTQQVRAMLSLLGKPSAIEPMAPGFQETLKRGVGELGYRLIYEKGDYVLVFQLRDTIPWEYGVNFLSVDSCLYYPIEGWRKLVDNMAKI